MADFSPRQPEIRKLVVNSKSLKSGYKSVSLTVVQEKGKAVTVSLTPEEARVFGTALAREADIVENTHRDNPLIPKKPIEDDGW